MSADPNDMLLFAAVVQHGGISAASRALRISKQAVSDRVARLERRLGVRLLVRTTRAVRPTEAGAAFGARCAELCSLVACAEREAQGTAEEPTGTLRVSAPVVFGRRVLGPILEELLARHPRLTVEVRLTDRRVRLLDEGFDVVIRVGPLEDSTLRARRVGRVRLCVVGTRDRVAAFRPRTVEALAAQPTIATDEGEAWTLGGKKLRLSPRLLVDDLEAAHDAARRGIGFARLPEPMCADDLASGALVEILRDSGPAAIPVHALTAPGRTDAAKITAFVDALTRAMSAPLRGT